MDYGEYRCSECGEMLVEMPKECPNCLSPDAKELIQLRHKISLLTRRLAILQQGLEEIREKEGKCIYSNEKAFMEGSHEAFCDCSTIATKTLKEAEEIK